MQTSKLDLNQAASVSICRNRQAHNDLPDLGGRFRVEHRDKDGNLKGVYELKNGITNVGKNSLLDIMFHATTQLTTWYSGLIDNSGYTGVAAGDTMSSHSGWNEFTTYSEATRVEWPEDAASGQSITNGGTPITYNITGSGTVKGVFIVSNSTKGGTTGTLWATALFTADVPVSNGDQLKVTYTVNA